MTCFSRNFGAERALVNKEFDEMQFPDIQKQFKKSLGLIINL